MMKISAYPVLIPLYLAQYARNTTVVLEAYCEMVRSFIARCSE